MVREKPGDSCARKPCGQDDNLFSWTERKSDECVLDPRLELTNNATERAVRPIAVGRKNWLFVHSERGVKASAIIHSIVETEKGANIKFFDYLRYIFDALRSCSFKKIE